MVLFLIATGLAVLLESTSSLFFSMFAVLPSRRLLGAIVSVVEDLAGITFALEELDLAQYVMKALVAPLRLVVRGRPPAVDEVRESAPIRSLSEGHPRPRTLLSPQNDRALVLLIDQLLLVVLYLEPRVLLGQLVAPQVELHEFLSVAYVVMKEQDLVLRPLVYVVEVSRKLAAHRIEREHPTARLVGGGLCIEAAVTLAATIPLAVDELCVCLDDVLVLSHACLDLFDQDVVVVHLLSQLSVEVLGIIQMLRFGTQLGLALLELVR